MGGEQPYLRARMTIFIEQQNGSSMRTVRDTTSGLRLIIVVFTLLLLMPGLVSAAIISNTTPAAGIPSGTALNVTPLPTTAVPPVFIYAENPTSATNPPPLLIFDPPVIRSLTSTIYGFVNPGSVNVTITGVLWDWGDGRTPEYHGFPNSHIYNSPGTYTFSITARQSDGQNITGITTISVGQSLIPGTVPVAQNTPVPGKTGGPVTVMNPPVLTLHEPAIDRMNVTLNGNLNAGSQNITIQWVSVDWDDGSITKSSDLPVAHRYSGEGIYSVSVTGIQSDGQSTTRKITLELNKENSTLPGPSNPPQNDLTAYLIIIAMAITGAVIIAVVLITQKKKEQPAGAGIPRATRTGPLRENRPSQEELKDICSGTAVEPDILGSVIQVAMEIAREGREGQAIGTAFVVGDTANVLNYSKQFVLNPFHGHHETERQITDAGIQGTIKEFAQLDGAFLITGNGVVEAAGRCITVDLSQVNLPKGMGSRHLSIASITKVTRSIGVVVSQSGGQISIFRDGKIVYTIRS